MDITAKNFGDASDGNQWATSGKRRRGLVSGDVPLNSYTFVCDAAAIGLDGEPRPSCGAFEHEESGHVFRYFIDGEGAALLFMKDLCKAARLNEHIGAAIVLTYPHYILEAYLSGEFTRDKLIGWTERLDWGEPMGTA